MKKVTKIKTMANNVRASCIVDQTRTQERKGVPHRLENDPVLTLQRDVILILCKEKNLIFLMEIFACLNIITFKTSSAFKFR